MTKPLEPVRSDRPTIDPGTPFLTPREIRIVCWGVVVISPLIVWVLATIAGAAHNSLTVPEPPAPSATLIAPTSPLSLAPGPSPAPRADRPSAARTAPRTAPRVIVPRAPLPEPVTTTQAPGTAVTPTGAPPSTSTPAPSTSAPPSSTPGSGRGVTG